jgi:hypothetical protein
MQLLKKIPFLLSWSVFYLLMLSITWMIGQWFFPSLEDLFPQLTPTISFVLLVALYVIIGFFPFILSIRKVALPLYRVSKNQADEQIRIVLGAYLLKWVLYLVYYAVYCIPLAIKGLLPPEIEEPIYIAWKIFASFLAYRGVVHSWFNDTVFCKPQSHDGQVIEVE